MRLTLIGMAGTGKSYWSKKLSRRGFKRFSCDDMIETRLFPELQNPDDSRISMGEWMGFPYLPRYHEREAKYLAFEKEVVREILGCLENDGGGSEEDIVIDTAGSVIYTGDDLLERLGKQTTIVLLSTPPQEQESLLRAYLSRPHPMLWQSFYKKNEGETHEDTLANCYPKLFHSRQRLYERYAAIKIGYDILRHEGFEAEDFLREVHTLMRN